jgi:hypothetical protein
VRYRFTLLSFGSSCLRADIDVWQYACTTSVTTLRADATVLATVLAPVAVGAQETLER